MEGGRHLRVVFLFDEVIRLEDEGGALGLLVAAELEVLATLDGELGPGLWVGVSIG